MAAADAVLDTRLVGQVACAALEHAGRLALDLVQHLVRTLVVPLERCLGADYADLVIVACAAVDRACPAVDLRTRLHVLAALEVHDDEGVVLELAALDERALGAHQIVDLHVRDHRLDDEQRVRADVAEREGRACLGRVKAPLCGRNLVLDLEVVAAEREAHVDDADLAEIAIFDHLARLLDELMAGVAVGHADNAVLFLRQLDQLVRLLRGEAQRLFADNVQTGLERRLADLVVHAVRGRDGDCLYTVRALGLLGEHGLIIGIAAVRVNVQLLTEVLAALRINVERAGNQFKVEVAQCSRTMDVADLAATAAADHAPANGVFYSFFTVIHKESSLIYINKKYCV